MIKIIDELSFRNYLRDENLVTAYRTARQSFGKVSGNHKYLAELLDISPCLCFALEMLCAEEKDPAENALDSISLFSLFKGLYLPLSSMSDDKIANLFSVRRQAGPQSSQELLEAFLAREVGLALTDKIDFLMGDPFSGRNSRTGQDTLLQVLSRLRLVSPRRLRDHLARIGDIGILFVQDVEKVRSDPPITAREALLALKGTPRLGTTRKKEVLCDLYLRAGRMERYFLTRLILRRLNFGYEYRRQAVARALATHLSIPESTIDNAIALTDIFEVAQILENEGGQGLEKLVLKPLNPFSPALAGSAGVDKKTRFPLWVECKYDGIRLMAHKETSPGGQVKFAAFTRRKYDWLEMVTSLEASLRYIPAHSFIIDGELHGKVGDWEGKGIRQATVYEVYRFLQGDTSESVQLQYIAFDILYLNERDLSKLPFLERRRTLEQLLAPLTTFKLPLPVLLSEGWPAKNHQDFQKWYRYFRNQGHEGAIAKIPDSPYSMGKRTDDWLKKKEDVYLDLVITGALWATSEHGPHTFSAYLLSCRNERSFCQIGRTQGLDKQNNFEIVQRIAAEGLITGRLIEERTSRGMQSGIELLPSIVATVRFENITRSREGVFSLRDPKIVYIRPRGDINVDDIDSDQEIRQLYLKKRLQ